MDEMREISLDDLKSAYARLFETAGRKLIADYRFLHLTANLPPWTDSGIALESADHLTTLAHGKVHLAGASEPCFPPSFQLWFRVGETGPIFRAGRDTNTFRAENSGKLYLGNHFPGEWADQTGRLATPVELYQAAAGGIVVAALRWRRGAEPLDAVRTLAAKGDPLGLLAAESNRLASFVPPPSGWDYLWFLGAADIFHRRCKSPGQIECRTRGDVGILHKDADFELTAATRLGWSWKIDALPSVVAENDAAVHDYMSIAVEFDNGQDLTYYWSAALEPGTSFRCPLPSWTARETHLVVRSGTVGLGRWFGEERNVHDDYRAAIGGPLPARIVRVWLIAVSLFQRREGRCEFADITLDDGAHSLKVT